MNATHDAARPFAVYSEHFEHGSKPVSTHATLLRAELAACEWNGHAWVCDEHGRVVASFKDKRRAPIVDPYRHPAPAEPEQSLPECVCDDNRVHDRRCPHRFT